MFKSWLRRKSPAPPEPPPAPLEEARKTPVVPESRLALASDPSLGKLPEGPRVPIRYRRGATILTSEIEDIASSALVEAVRRRVPDLDFGSAYVGPESTKPSQRPTALGAHPSAIKAVQSGRKPLLCGVTYVPGIDLEIVQKQSFVNSCWWWPQSREVVAQTKAFAGTVVLGGIDTIPPKERILLELQLVAAALDVLKTATAVVWPDADAMWRPELFRSELEKAKGEIPIPLVVATKIGRDTENLRPDRTPTWFGRTEGLNAFGVMEVEWRAFDGEIPDLATWLSSIAWYLINKGPIIGDGHSMGSDAPGVMPPVVIRHEPSTTVPGMQAYIVYPKRLS